MKTAIAVLALTTSMAVAQPVYIPDGKYIGMLAEFYRDTCENAGGDYYADYDLLAKTDIQLWRCTGGDWCATYPELPSCKRGDDDAE